MSWGQYSTWCAVLLGPNKDPKACRTCLARIAGTPGQGATLNVSWAKSSALGLVSLFLSILFLSESNTTVYVLSCDDFFVDFMNTKFMRFHYFVG